MLGPHEDTSMRALLRTADLTPDDLTLLLDLAAEVKARPFERLAMLRGEIVLVYMAKPSTRTRLSFDAAIHRLGGDAVVVSAADLQLGRGETIEDTAKVVSRYARAVVMRTAPDAELRRFAAAASIPVVNALTDLHHPCQSLADLLTIRERCGPLRGLRIAYVGDATNVAHSLIEGAALAGARIAVATPRGFEPDAEVVARATAIAAGTGADVRVLADPAEAVAGAAVVYTDTWFSMGVSDEERARRLRALAPYRVAADLMARAAADAVFMHCLPAHRDEEVAREVIDGPQSVVFEQAENRLHTEQAVLVALLERRLEGSAEAAA
jgi:ornithine carbamoyltransferase